MLSRISKLRSAGIAAGGVAAVAGLSLAGLSMAAPAGASVMHPFDGYTFRTLDNHRDTTFNQLLGINNSGLISGYFGSGMSPAHPNKGYLLRKPYGQGNYVNENFPHSTQTQVTGLNNIGNTVGFWANKAGANFGFYTTSKGKFRQVDFPGGDNTSPQVDQLLGINDHGIAVGFFTNVNMLNRGYTYDIYTHKFSRVLEPGTPDTVTGPSLTAAAINNAGWIAGYYVTKGGVTDAFVKYGSHFRTLAFPGASMTQAFGINNNDEVVGAYTTGTGSSALTFGFTWTPKHGFKMVNDPHGIGSTTINGVNDKGDLVGFYMVGSITHGFLATP
jgi:hypothetical protein